MMTLEKAVTLVQSQMARMTELYGKTLFNEWAIVAVADRKGRILHYEGQRRSDLQQTLAGDLGEFGTALVRGEQEVGDFDFSRHAVGSHFDAYVVLGAGIYLICNNTLQSMAGITKDPLWLQAQVPFVELSDRFRADPVEAAS
jgi:hypothetical protein